MAGHRAPRSRDQARPSTGLSDIVPATGHARSVIMLEQLAGIFYIAMVVTRLVALRAYRHKDAA